MKRNFMSFIISLFFAAFGFSIEKAQFNIMNPEKKVLGYFEGLKKAEKENKPLILFVDSEVKEIDGFIVAYEKELNDPQYPKLKKGFILTWFDKGNPVGDTNEDEFSEQLLYSRMSLRNLTIPEKLKARFEKSPIVQIFSPLNYQQQNCTTCTKSR